MFLFDLLFGKKESSASNEPDLAPVAPVAAAPDRRSAPGTRIGYDPALVVGLLNEHRLLLDIFGAIAADTKADKFATVEQRLEHFRVALRNHLLKENVRLYVYLEHLLEGDSSSHEMMHDFRREMDGIGKVVVGFLTKYQSIGSQPQLQVQFPQDLEQIGKALVARIESEENTLYPMYAPPG